jgi:cellobiose phosphorylase
VPHGLEQSSGAAWVTRDVCQGPLELLLSLEHDETARAILRVIFAQQYENSGGWPQWFMLEPYSAIQDREAHGDVIVWPLKALCDYVEATGDLAFLDEPVAWRREDNIEETAHTDPVGAHVEKLVAAVRERFIPGTRLIRYGNGDWNDSLQPVDATMRDWMASSCEIGLMYVHSHLRYAEAMSLLHKPKALWEALLIANPIAVTDRLPHASFRQRNAYFSSSDVAFPDRYRAISEWRRVKTDDVAVDGGWRIYSSGPGLYTYILIQHVFGLRCRFGKGVGKACLPASLKDVRLAFD